MLAISISTAGAPVVGPFTVDITDDASAFVNNHVELRFNPGGSNDLEISVNGGAFATVLCPGGVNANFTNISVINVNLGPGEDALEIDLQTFAFDASIGPDLNNSLETDITLFDTGGGGFVPLVVTGSSLVRFDGSGANDNLTYKTGQGNVSARVDNAPVNFTDQVTTSDPAPPRVEFLDLNRFRLEAIGIGPVTATFATGALSGANTYESDLNDLDTLIVEGADGLNDNFTMLNPAAGLVALTDSLSGVTVTEIGSGVTQVRVNGLGGNDVLTVDTSTGLIGVPIQYAGEGGNDSLIVRGTTGATNLVYTPGPAAGAGALNYDSGAMTISFTGLEPIVDTLVVANLTVNGTNADNAINYTAGPNSGNPAAPFLGANTGLVSIDGFETLEFINKTNLILNGLAGSDTINLNNPSTPGGPLSSITVNGGDPAASDTLIVNGVAGALDSLRHIPTALGAGSVVNDSFTQPPVAFTGLEYLELVVQEGDGDDVRLEGTTGDDRIEFFQGATADRGTFRGTLDETNTTGGGPFALTETAFRGVNHATNDEDVNFFNPGGTDTFVFNGTADDDLIAVGIGDGGGTEFRNTVNGDIIARVEVFNVATALVRGHDGDDQFNHAGVVAIPVAYEGGNPGSGSDVLNLTGAPLTAETVTIRPDSTNSTEQDIIGFGAPIDVSGVELITYAGTPDGAGSPDDTLTFDPGAGDDTVRVTSGVPSLLTDMVTSNNMPVIEFTGLNAFVVDANSSGGADVVTFVTRALHGALPGNYGITGGSFDTLVIEGADGAADNYQVANPAGPGSVAVVDLSSQNSNVTVSDTAGLLGRLQINSLGGDDLVNVDDTNGLIRPSITYDGGSGSDTLLVTGTMPVAQTEYMPGPAVTEGRLAYSLAWGPPSHDMIIDFVNLEPIIDLLPTTVAVTVYGTNADNAINFTEGPNAGELVAATGLVSVDGFETYEFANKGEVLEILGLGGDDVINLNYQGGILPPGLARIWVEGNDPTASDTVIVNGTAGFDFIDVAPTGSDSADIRVNGFLTQVFTTEFLSINGQGGNDSLVLTTPTGGQIVVLVDGPLSDAGTIAMRDFGGDAYIPFEFLHLGFSGTLTVADAGLARVDELVVNASDPANVGAIFNVSAGGTITLTSPSAPSPARELVDVHTPSVSLLRLHGFDGDDIFNVPGDHPFGDGIWIEGGEPGTSDVLNFTGSGAGAVTVSLGAQSITEAVFDPVFYAGVEMINVNSSGHNLNVEATTGDDSVVVEPTGLNAITVTALDHPTINGSNIGDFTVDGLGGDDNLSVRGSTAGEVIDVDGSTVDVDGLQTVDFVGFEALRVDGAEGDDEFNVHPAAIPIFIDGGDPVGTTAGDLLNYVYAGPVAFEPGPESDEGGFVNGATERVSFDHIEGITVAPGPGPVLIFGTNGDDDITIIARDDSTHPILAGLTPGERDFTVSVNGGPEILFINTATLYVDALAGDDDIVVRAPAPNQADWDVDITVVGGPPAASDRLVFETPGPGVHSVDFTPTGIDTGEIVLDQGAPGPSALDSQISMVSSFTLVLGPFFTYHSSPGGIEHFIYNGQGGDDTLTIHGDGLGAATDEDFVHTPGTLADSGRVDVAAAGANSLLGASYENLGLNGVVIIDGEEGNNRLVAVGTQDSDVMEISFPAYNSAEISLTTPADKHVLVVTRDVGEYELRVLEGDDEVHVHAPVWLGASDGPGRLAVFGGGPSGSDALFLHGAAATAEDILIEPDAANPLNQDVTGLGAPIDVSGMELITYMGAGDDDLLTIDPGLGDHAVRVDNGPANLTDRVRSDSLPEIQFTGLNTFLVNPSGDGINVVTFVTRALAGAVNYHADLSAFDALVIEGREGTDDNYTLTHPTGTNVVITDNNAGVSVTEVDSGNPVAGLRINTLGGDDVVTVDVGSDDLIRVPIEYNGGSGSDTLIVSGTPNTGIDEVIYTPGPTAEKGRLVYEDLGDTRLMLIDFVNLEPVIDLVPAATLTVLGTNANNAISYIQSPTVATWGKVTVDGFESIEFANKVELVLDALAGDDVVSINNQSTPTGLTSIVVDGGDPTASDKLVYTGSGAITVTQGTAPYDGTITNAPLPPVTFTDTERVAVTATGAADILTIEGTDVSERITIDVGNAFGAGSAKVDGGFNTTFTGAERVDVVANDLRSDNLTINGRDAADRFSLTTGGLGTSVRAATNESVPQTLLVITFGDDVEHLLLETLGGDDIIDIDAAGIAVSDLITVTVSGDGPSGSDTLNFVRHAAGAAEVIVELDATSFGDLVQEISQAGIPAPVRLLGIETVKIDAEEGDLYVAGTRADDVITYVPMSGDSGRFTAEGIPTVFYFDDLPEGLSGFVITGGGTGLGGPVGGGFADKVIVVGTSGSDLMTANVVTRNIGLDVLGFGFPPPVIASWRSVSLDDGTTAFGTPGIIEAVTVDGRDGNDTFHVVMRDNGIPAAPVGNGLYVDVQGGSPRASDALVVTAFDAAGDPVALPATDFVVVGKSRIPDAGNILVYQSAVRRPHISYDNVEVVSPNVASGDHVLILGPDMHEENEYRQTASILGTADVINLQNLAIFPNVDEHPGVPADQDWFAVKAKTTGTLDITISFRTFSPALLPAGGQLGIQVVDATGTVIAGDGTLVGGIVPSGFGAYDGDPDARVRFPAIAGQTYYFRVFGQSNVAPFVANDQAVNGYDMTIVNEAAPVPYDIELADIIAASTVSAGAVLNTFSVAPSDTLSEIDDFYNGKYIYFLSGNLAGRRAEIADYVAATRTFTLVAGGVLAAPSAGSVILVETHDTGRSQFDNVTRDATPVIRFRLDDAGLLYDLPGNTVADSPTDESIRIPFNPNHTRDTSTPGYRVAVFIEGVPQQPGTEPQVPIGYARPIDIDGDGIPDGIYEFDFNSDAIDLANPNGATTAFVLTNGSHFISAKVQIVDPDDPDNNAITLNNLTAFGARSVSHEIVVDTVIPPVWFGDPIVALDGLHPDSDTGIENQPVTFVDRITSDTTPSFWGTAEADTIVYVYADRNGNGVLDLNVDVLLGKTVAVPNDGTNQYPNGQWNMTTNIDMNDPAYFPVIDGTRRIFAIAEDVAGNVTHPAAAQVLDIFVDTRGPQVNAVEITTAPAYDLFDPKPSTDGPTPLVFSLDIDFIDRPNRAAPFIYPALNQILATTPGNIVLVGDYNGVIPIQSIIFIDSTVNGGLGTTTVRLNFFAPLPDDRYTLTISDRITDVAFNALDGESHVQEPQENPSFPSGDGVPGGDFIARFTIDSRPEVATYAAGNVWVDTNGNTFFDPDNLDYTNRDIIYTFGFTSDDLFVGNFAEPAGGVADGFDKLAAYGRVPGGGFRWMVDTDNDGVPNINVIDPLQRNGLPVAGRFDGNDGNGDEVGLYTANTSGGSIWYFDTNHDFRLDAASALVSQLHGVPFVGDFDGDGFDDLGTWQDDTFYIDLAGGVLRGWDGTIDVTFRFGVIGVREKPVAADMDQDGYDDIGLWVPDRSGVTPREGSEWFILVSNGASLFDRIVFNADLGVPAIDFTPVPFGPDLYMQFGDEYAMPLLGNFDPPVAAATSEENSGVFQINGTEGDDEFFFHAGADGQTWTVTLNGVAQAIPAGTEQILFNGLGGKDTGYLRGSDGDDVFASGPAGATLSGANFAVTTQNVETIYAYGMAGSDIATLNDTSGNDNFKADLELDYAKMSGGGYFTRAKFFETVNGVFSEGADDYARIWDSKGNDQMTASFTGLTFTSDRFNVNVEAFDRLLAYSKYGGTDVANLYDSPGDDTMRARSHKTLFWGPGYEMTLRGWGQVLAHSTHDGDFDQAKLHDTLGDDVVLTGDSWASLSTVVDDKLDLLYAAYGFDVVKAYHSGGNDKAPNPSAVDFLMLDDDAGWELL